MPSRNIQTYIPLSRLRVPVRERNQKNNKGDTDMQKNGSKKFTSCILCIMLIVATASFTAGCNGSTKKTPSAQQAQDSAGNDSTAASSDEDVETGAPDTWPDGSVIGEGSKQLSLTVADETGSEVKLEIHTDQSMLGAALSELGLIDGEEGEYGLYVKTVNGKTADYDTDGMYWALYINDEYAQSGVDTVEIKEGDSYSFKMEKA